MSTLVGEFVVARRVCKGFVESICFTVMLMDQIEFNILVSDVILGLDLLHSCSASIECRTHKVIFKFPY